MAEYNVFRNPRQLLCINNVDAVGGLDENAKNAVGSIDSLLDDSFDIGISINTKKTSQTKTRNARVQSGKSTNKRSKKTDLIKSTIELPESPAPPVKSHTPPRSGLSRSVCISKSRTEATVDEDQTCATALEMTSQSEELLDSMRVTTNRRTRGNRDLIRSERGATRGTPATASTAFVVERAPRCTTTDYIDLVSSPMKPVQGVINLDSDEEQQPNVSKELKAPQEPFDADNPEVTVNMMWKGSLQEFKLRKYQKFEHLFRKLAEDAQCAVENIVCNSVKYSIAPHDTPASINFKSYNLICRVKSDLFKYTKGKQPKKRDANTISLKIQSDKFRRRFQVELQKSESFKILYIKCAEERNLPMRCVKLSFDGEILSYNDTPEVLDFEGGEVIDMRILQ